MMAKVECKKIKGKSGLHYEAVRSAQLTCVDSKVRMLAVIMQCLLFIIFLLLFVPNISSAALPTIETLPPIADHLKNPSGIVVDSNENIYVAEATEDRVHIFSSAGQYQKSISGLEGPTAVAVDLGGKIYIGNARNGSGNVQVYNPNLELIGTLGIGNGEFKTPVGVAVSSAGLIYVVDGGKHKVNVYNADFSFNFSFGSQGPADGQFQAPTSIVINEVTGEILIPDLTASEYSARVQVFNFNGEFQRSFITTGTDEANNIVPFRYPYGITVDTLDRIYVTDGYQNIVTVYDTVGTYLGKLYDNNRPLRNPKGITFASGSSRLFIASLNTNTVETFGVDSVYGSIAVSPQSYSFTNVNVNDAPVNKNFDISNTGSGGLLIGAITLTGTDASEFSIVSNNCADTTLVPAAGCAVEVQFKPTSAGSKNASLSIVSDDLYMPTLTVALSGNAELQQYKLTIYKSGSGSGTVQAEGINCGAICSADYVAGKKLTLLATKGKDEDSVFAGWSGGGCKGTGECSITMDQPINVTAVFNNNPVPVANSYSITASAGTNGSISPAGTVSADAGSVVTFEITADTDYRVSDVLVDSVSVGAVGSYSFTNVGGNHTIEAKFTAVSTLLLSSIEMGELSVSDEWQQVALNSSFTNPIVVVKPASLNDTSSAVIQVRNVSAQGFEVRMREWDYLLSTKGESTNHKEEQMSYVVIERGSYVLDDGTRVEAGQFSTDVSSASFTQTFGVAPIVISSIVTNNDANDTPVVVQMSNIGVNGFNYELQEEELNDQVHAVETVSFIAWEPSQGLLNGIKFEVGKVSNALPEQAVAIEFSGSYTRQPRFIADLQNASGGVFNLRWSGKSATGISLLIDQEESLQNPISTLKQDIGYLLLSSFDGDCDRLSDEDEINIYHTDPQLADTDGDGLLDGYEVDFWLGNWNGDIDGDGLINLLDIDSAGNGFRDGSLMPVGDGAPIETGDVCGGSSKSDEQEVDGEEDAGGEEDAAGSNQESEAESGSGSSRRFNRKAAKFGRNNSGFKRNSVKFKGRGVEFKRNNKAQFEREGTKFNRD